MRKLLSFLTFSASLMLAPAYAGPCVKIRNGSDGYDCMKFSKEERKKASKYGLRLGIPYETAKQQLNENGWALDQNWFNEEDTFYSRRGDLVCGYGLDAICWTVYRKGKEEVSMVFSGTNDGTPLISVDIE